jgi:DNA polymerase-3 subunit alpha
VQSGSVLADPKRFKFDGDQFYLKSAAEMRQIFKDHPEACDNTLLIAERVNVTLREGENLMPQFPVPTGETEDSWLVKESEAGLAKIFNGKVPDAYKERLRFELDVMKSMGFPGYFLVVADLVGTCKTHWHSCRSWSRICSWIIGGLCTRNYRS